MQSLSACFLFSYCMFDVVLEIRYPVVAIIQSQTEIIHKSWPRLSVNDTTIVPKWISAIMQCALPLRLWFNRRWWLACASACREKHAESSVEHAYIRRTSLGNVNGITYKQHERSHLFRGWNDWDDVDYHSNSESPIRSRFRSYLWKTHKLGWQLYFGCCLSPIGNTFWNTWYYGGDIIMETVLGARDN